MRPVHRPEKTVGGSVSTTGQLHIPPVFFVSLLALLVLGHWPSAARAQDPPPDDEAPVEVSETLTVTDTRLRDRPGEERSVPANVTVLGRSQIERGDAQTLQDLLSSQAGVVLFDQVGDDVSKTLDLRGFGGTGTRVFLNGAPLNEPRNNSLSLELVPLEMLERIEITRGSTAALAGGGSEAGVINLWTRRGESFGGSLSLAAGDFGTLDADAALGHRVGRTDFFVSASLYETDGFRDNSDGDLQRLAADVGWSLGENQRLGLSIVDGSADFRNPGALTADELATDPEQAPFNALDFTDENFSQAVLNYGGNLSDSWTLSANVYARDSGAEVLTTGRAAPAFGGFFFDSDSSQIGSAVQLGFGTDGESSSNLLNLGLEWLDGETDAMGFSTPPTDLSQVSPQRLSSNNTAERETLALFAQDRWQFGRGLTLTGGARYDDEEVGYEERFPDAGNDAVREFSELSLRAGLTWSLSERYDVYGSFGEAFLPPTVEELFSFPLFGSNPDLKPQDSRSLELGFRGRWSPGTSLDVALFQIDTEDEIVFDPDSPLGLFGANVNLGEARRQGLEVGARGPLGGSVDGFANLTLMSPEFSNGPNEGKTLPLVPEERLSVGFDARLPRSFGLRASVLYVGEQVLDNDDANAVAPLDSYTVVNARFSWSTGRERRATLFVDARNLFDEEYATRGIFAFDFQTFRNETFLTPAPGRRVVGGVEWRF
jgi:iron complex outermembrane receptor protein